MRTWCFTLALCLVLALPASLAASLTSPRSAEGPIAFEHNMNPESGITRNDIYVVNADGSGLRNLTRHLADDIEAAWSPDGRRLAFVRWGRRDRRLYTMNAAGSGQRLLIDDPDVSSPAWSPDGKTIAFVRELRGVGESTEIFLVNADGTGKRRLTHNRARDLGPAWSPDGKLIAFWRTPPLPEKAPAGVSVIDSVYTMSPDGRNVRRLTRGRSFTEPAWSPDGRLLAVVSPNGLHVLDSDGGVVRRLTRGENDNSPSWSPNGRLIVFARYPGIYVVNSDGTGQRRIVPPADRPEYSFWENWAPQWSPVG
jgi:TolB protein